MSKAATTGRCRGCGHFRNDPAYLEEAFAGYKVMSSAWGCTRAEDGICLKHDRYLSADAFCADFTPVVEPPLPASQSSTATASRSAPPATHR